MKEKMLNQTEIEEIRRQLEKQEGRLVGYELPRSLSSEETNLRASANYRAKEGEFRGFLNALNMMLNPRELRLTIGGQTIEFKLASREKIIPRVDTQEDNSVQKGVG